MENHNIFGKSPFYVNLLEDLKDEALLWQVSYELGGLRYYIPSKVQEKHHFMKYGKPFFEWLVENYGGTAIVFPSGANSSYKRNQIQAQLLAQKGYSHNEIARQLGINYSSARRAKKRVFDQKQGNLF